MFRVQCASMRKPFDECNFRRTPTEWRRLAKAPASIKRFSLGHARFSTLARRVQVFQGLLVECFERQQAVVLGHRSNQSAPD